MRLEELTWVKAKEYFDQNDMIIITTGSIESHGKHVALGTDTLIPNRILELIEEKSDVMMAPTVPYGACDSLADFPGTVSLGTDVLYDVLTKMTESFYRWGVRKFVFLNGHGGNTPVLNRICYDLDNKGALGAIMNWWLMAWDLNPAWKGGHGGAEETAAMLAVNPKFVDPSAMEDMVLKDVSEGLPATGFSEVTFKGVKISIPRKVVDVTDNGWIGPDHPKHATIEWGTEMLQATADYIVDFMNEFKKVSL